MDTTTCTTIILALLWLYLCVQALCSLVALMQAENSAVLYSTITLSSVLLGLCLWQCKKAGYLVSPMTWYHWVLLVLLVLLQVLAVILEQMGQQTGVSYHHDWKYPIYGVSVLLLGILGGSLYCGWKCNLFCRPCCKSQYICYGSAISLTLMVLTVLAVTAALTRFLGGRSGYDADGNTDKAVIHYLGYLAIPITQIYATVVIWITLIELPYTMPEVVTLLASALAVASVLALAVMGNSMGDKCTVAYPLLALHLVSLGITWYFLTYKKIFYWPKDYMCFGLLAAIVILVAMLGIVIKFTNSKGIYSDVESVKYTLLGYSFLLMVPTLWYAYRCGLLTWRWNSCLPKKKGLKATDNAENTTPDTVIAKE